MEPNQNILKAKELVDLALKNSGNADRYCRRLKSNPTLAELGCLPQNMTEISNLEPRWLCHGLAFRMATYSDDSDDLFDRWETLLKLAQQAEGWSDEYAHWNNVNDHWAKKWDKFHHFLWLLQCYEYFLQRGLNVSFPASNNEAKPDLLIRRLGQEVLYAECYFYSKWWHQEHFLEDLLGFVNPNLRIERKYNLSSNASTNLLAAESEDQFIALLGHLATALQPDELAKLKSAAKKAWPRTVYETDAFNIILKGSGEYRSDANNAHGNPADSWPVFMKEVIEAKKQSNNLNGSHPNIVMVNGLGVDFQLSHGHAASTAELPSSIDEIWIAKCGIDESLENCPPVLKSLREGYAGSGF
jgi:hypothetical protein